MKRIFISSVLPILLFITSCVSKEKYHDLEYKYWALEKENNELKQRLEYVQFNAEKLLREGKRFFEVKDYPKAKLKFQSLVKKHENSPLSIEANKYLQIVDEEYCWYMAIQSDEISNTKKYILTYPAGKYLEEAKRRLNKLDKINMQKAYDESVKVNTSYQWKRFLEEYPKHKKAAWIKNKIIRLEVDEIMGNISTGKIPSFDQNNVRSGTNTSRSSVSISNDTGCQLIIRYSGREAKMIIIPIGQTKTVYLKSGKYKIAASACGSNYAGIESLYGDYNSTFYIQTVRY